MKRDPEATVLRHIDRLRKEHTAAFEAQDWALMQRIGDKIKKAWDKYHGLQERLK